MYELPELCKLIVVLLVLFEQRQHRLFVYMFVYIYAYVCLCMLMYALHLSFRLQFLRELFLTHDKLSFVFVLFLCYGTLLLLHSHFRNNIDSLGKYTRPNIECNSACYASI